MVAGDDGGAPEPKGPGRGKIAQERTTHATRDEITRAALSIIDREGVAALSMRRLGAEVHLTARALYTHFDGRGDVIDSVVDLVWDEVAAEISATPPTSDEWIMHGLICIRRVFLQHPQVALYVAAAPKLDQRLLDSIDAFAGIMDMSGFADPYQSFHLLMQFTYGSVVLGAARQITNAELGRDEAELRGWMVDNVGSITRPRTTRGQIARALLPEAHEELFEQELRRIADALRTRP